MLHLIGYVSKIPVRFSTSSWDCSLTHNQLVQEQILENYPKWISKNWAITSSHGGIFNIVGEMVWQGVISTSDVRITLYDENLKETDCHYSEKGFIQNFPFGFFDPRDVDWSKYKNYTQEKK